MAIGIALFATVFTGALGSGSLADPAATAHALDRTLLVAGIVGLAGAAGAAVLIAKRPAASEKPSGAVASAGQRG